MFQQGWLARYPPLIEKSLRPQSQAFHAAMPVSVARATIFFFSDAANKIGHIGKHECVSIEFYTSI